MRQVVILLGPPGAGKGTIASSLVKEIGLPWLSTGDLLRAEISSGSRLGEEISRLIDAGNFVPDQLMIQLVTAEILSLPAHGDVLLDGFPRNVLQAEAFDDFARQNDAEVNLVVELKVNPQETARRIVRRRVKEGRADDTLTALRRRMTHFERQTLPVCRFFQQREVLQTVDGIGSPEQVMGRIYPLIRKALRPRRTERQKEAG